MVRDPSIAVMGCWSYLLSQVRNAGEFSGKLVSFSDNRFHSGDVYQHMGMSADGKVAPDYYWVVNGIHRHKSALRKHGAERTCGLTERELRSAQGYFRVWDCGKKKWSVVL